MTDHTNQALMQFANALSAALMERDAYTRFHSERVMNISAELGAGIGIPSGELALLKTASTLHDIGKIGIPDEILLKAGALDDEELSVMQTHSERGSHIILALNQRGADPVAEAVMHHHENFDGSGYPGGLAGEDIPILSRIIMIADHYDAMATQRVYQQPRSHGAIIGEMLGESGRKLDPGLLEVFMKLIEKSECKVD